MEPSHLTGCLYSLNDVYSHLWKIKVFCNKINKFSVIVFMLFLCDSGDIFQICFLVDYSCVWTLYWVRIPVRVPLKMRKRKHFTFLFDHAESANIHLYSALRIQLEEGVSHILGTQLFLALVTITAFAKRITNFCVSLARFQISRWQIYDLKTAYSHVRLFRL